MKKKFEIFLVNSLKEKLPPRAGGSFSHKLIYSPDAGFRKVFGTLFKKIVYNNFYHFLGFATNIFVISAEFPIRLHSFHPSILKSQRNHIQRPDYFEKMNKKK